jgi:hypothetical protein
MQFVIIFGQGRFLSRHVHQVILDVIDRAMAAFSATGMNPDRYNAPQFCPSFDSEIYDILLFAYFIFFANFHYITLLYFDLYNLDYTNFLPLENKRMKNKL